MQEDAILVKKTQNICLVYLHKNEHARALSR